MKPRDERDRSPIQTPVLGANGDPRVAMGSVLGTRVAIHVREPLPDVDIEEALGWLRLAADPQAQTSSRDLVAGVRREGVDADDAAELAQLLEACLEIRSETRGAFDPCASGRFDPGAVVVEWVMERAASLLEMFGARNFRMSAGSHTLIRGWEALARPWQVHLSPTLARPLVMSGRGAVATCTTSGGRDPVIDPRNGRALRRRGAAVVTGPDLARAAGYSVGLWVDAAEGIDWFQRLTGYEALLLLDGTYRCTPGFPLNRGEFSDGRTEPGHPSTVRADAIIGGNAAPLPSRTHGYAPDPRATR